MSESHEFHMAKLRQLRREDDRNGTEKAVAYWMKNGKEI